MTTPGPSIPYVVRATLDDLMNDVLRMLFDRGAPIRPTKGPAVEVTGVLLELTNPRARLSRTVTRGRLFSALGEFCWYLAGSDALDVVRRYIPQYPAPTGGGMVVEDAYGPRLFPLGSPTGQIGRMIELLGRKPDTRQAVVQLFRAEDLDDPGRDVPCTCTLQFLRRGERVHLVTYMRSNDVYYGLPHDVFSFTMLQEVVASALGLDVGVYKHAVGSLHLYDEHAAAARQFLDEGYQSTFFAMPQMPAADPWPAIGAIRRVEPALRAGAPLSDADIADLDSYWADLLRLLDAYFAADARDADRIARTRARMAAPVYDVYIEQQRQRALRPRAAGEPEGELPRNA